MLSHQYIIYDNSHLKSIAQDIGNFTHYAVSISLLSVILASIGHLLTTLSGIFGTSTVTKNVVGIVASLLMYIHASRVEVVVREEANHVGEEKLHAIDIKDVSVLAGVTSFFIIVLCLLHKLDGIDPTTYDPLDDDSAVAGDDDYDAESNDKDGNGKPKIR
jgi:hypothetical protein